MIYELFSNGQSICFLRIIDYDHVINVLRLRKWSPIDRLKSTFGLYQIVRYDAEKQEYVDNSELVVILNDTATYSLRSV